jgi:glycosyltransferase involved in cell wall biosynthesis
MDKPAKPINLFYEEPDPDRWFKYDRYLRKYIRRLVRGKARPGGVMTIAINLMKGMEKIGVPYRFNDYSYISKHPEEIACIIGKPHVLLDRQWTNPIIFGSGVFSHPVDCPDLFEIHPNVKRFVVPGDWMKKMCEPWYGEKVIACPAGIDISEWTESETRGRPNNILIYDKINRNREVQVAQVLNPIKVALQTSGLPFQIIRYGEYDHKLLKAMLSRANAVIWLSESETQGIAYQQILATNTPILAWDRGGYWQDPAYYPDRIKYQPVTSVPYWDERCGTKFMGMVDFQEKLKLFLANLQDFKPREYIMANLTLEKCAEKYLAIYTEVERELA